jgi:hypothetical protein
MVFGLSPVLVVQLGLLNCGLSCFLTALHPRLIFLILPPTHFNFLHVDLHMASAVLAPPPPFTVAL